MLREQGKKAERPKSGEPHGGGSDSEGRRKEVRRLGVGEPRGGGEGRRGT